MRRIKIKDGLVLVDAEYLDYLYRIGKIGPIDNKRAYPDLIWDVARSPNYDFLHDMDSIRNYSKFIRNIDFLVIESGTRFIEIKKGRRATIDPPAWYGASTFNYVVAVKEDSVLGKQYIMESHIVRGSAK